MKKFISCCLTVLTFQFAFTQPNARLQPVNNFTRSVELIVGDFRNNFTGIQGELLDEDAASLSFASTVKFNEASRCYIRRYRSVKDSSASWHAVMYEGDEWKDAVKVYKNACRSVLKSRITCSGKLIGFSGRMNDISENIGFAESMFQLKSDERLYEDFFAVVELINGMDSWSVNLTFFKKKKDEEN